jgi:hypothetical protein
MLSLLSFRIPTRALLVTGSRNSPKLVLEQKKGKYVVTYLQSWDPLKTTLSVTHSISCFSLLLWMYSQKHSPSVSQRPC